jgi:hypothetical protein
MRGSCGTVGILERFTTIMTTQHQCDVPTRWAINDISMTKGRHMGLYRGIR